MVKARFPVDLRFPALLLVFTGLYWVLLALPAIAHAEFPLRRDLEWGDALDLATPLVLVGLIWVVAHSVGDVSGRVLAALVAISVLWSQGQGMHLAANAINHHVDATTNPELAGVVDFLDETLSHYVWQVGALAVPAFFLAIAWSRSGGAPGADWRPFVLLGGTLWGAILALDAIESVVVPLALPVLIVVAGLGCAGWAGWSRRPAAGQRHPLYDFSASACVVAALVLIGWGIYHGGWPELSSVGLI